MCISRQGSFCYLFREKKKKLHFQNRQYQSQTFILCHHVVCAHYFECKTFLFKYSESQDLHITNRLGCFVLHRKKVKLKMKQNIISILPLLKKILRLWICSIWGQIPGSKNVVLIFYTPFALSFTTSLWCQFSPNKWDISL